MTCFGYPKWKYMDFYSESNKKGFVDFEELWVADQSWLEVLRPSFHMRWVIHFSILIFIYSIFNTPIIENFQVKVSALRSRFEIKRVFGYFNASYMTESASCHNNRHELTNCVVAFVIMRLASRNVKSEAKAAIDCQCFYSPWKNILGNWR